MEQILRTIKKIIPKPVFRFFQPAYHFILSFLGALIYAFPSKKLFVIGVTGTKGKTTTCNLIAQIFNSCGLKTGIATTVNFRIGEREWANTSKQTMLGRFQLQNLISQMVKNDCKCAVVETSSEGILQYRHKFIDYDAAVFTNLSPEHIERHGSFEKYRRTKIKLFEKVARKPNGIGIYNLDDENVGYFLKPKITKQFVYTLELKKQIGNIQNLYQVDKINFNLQGTSFLLNSEEYKTSLIGEFNVYNAVAAICMAIAEGIPRKQIKKALPKAKTPAGRFEIISTGQNFNVIIDYAHEPTSLEFVYKTAKSQIAGRKARLICLLGSQGGGRDKWKRPEMGKIAAKYCDKIVLTDEDPYDEPPMEIINDIEKGIAQIINHKSQSVFKIIDRREAVKKVLSLAKKDDVVILTGKAGEVWMCLEGGRKTPWNERQVVEDELKNL